MRFKKTLFIFHRDLRLFDNRGLIEALKESKEVIPAFVFTPEQISFKKNPYRSDFCLNFMFESLIDLNQALFKKNSHLYLFFGPLESVVKKLIKKLSIKAIYSNRDYTPYSQKRDEKLKKVCEDFAIDFYSYHDALLFAPEMTCKKNQTPFTKFSPFFKNCQKLFEIEQPIFLPKSRFYRLPISSEENFKTMEKKVFLNQQRKKNKLQGGRKEGLKILKNLKNFKNYAKFRNDFSLEDSTTHLSPHLKFTTLSIREVFYAITKTLWKNHELIRQLYFREYFTMIAYFFPKIFGSSFYEKFDRKLKWDQNQKRFLIWCQGKTGFPVVDAAMRELKKTGMMHNRLRMIVASFLIKDLHIDWRWGEKYFAQKLIDYDPSVNNGNWQWMASLGADSQPYYRIINPWTQQQKYDPKCIYIKKWIPELQNFPPEIIHNWHEKKYDSLAKNYPRPIVLDHTQEMKKITLPRYRKVFSKR